MALDHLAVYLSNSCNLACSYCYVSVNQGPPVSLKFEQIKQSIDSFYAKVAAPNRKITFLGGEPLLNWPVFQRAATYARRMGGDDVVLQTFTNGTLLTPDKLSFLEETGVHVTVSLDGRKADNDKHRVYFKSTERSVFDDVVKNLEALPKTNLGVSLVFTSETIDHFLGNVDFFHRMGFGRITFNPELYESWSTAKLDVMRASLRGLTRYYKRILESGQRPFQMQILFAVLESLDANKAGLKWWHDCHNVVLGPEGAYYSCDKPLTLEIGTAKAQRVGDAERGLDWDKRAALLAEASAFVEKDSGGHDEIFCPMGVYFYSREARQDPRPMLANFHRVADVFAEGLAGLVAECGNHPAFQDLYVNTRVV
jgi:sulfatase maturation enzyme AslB (radical SAM superfamily)